MQQYNNDMENKLKQLEHQQLPDLSSMDEHWKQMNHLLAAGEPTPPRKKYWKKITRRTISYMGVAAVVITTTYYAMKSGSKNKAHKNVVETVKQNTTVKPTTVVNAQSPYKTVPQPIAASKRKQVIVERVREESDTVFLKPEFTAANTAIPTLGDLYQSLKPMPQQFEINTERDTMLRGSQGTTIKIQAHSFVYSNNEPATKTVRLTLLECYNYADMLASNLTTTSNGQQLVTGGMINLLANDAGNKVLKLKQGRRVELSMPTKKFDPAMQLFVDAARERKPQGNRDTASSSVPNWVPAGQPQGYFSNIVRRIQPKNNIKLFDVRQSVKEVNQQTEPVYFVKTEKQLTDEKIRELISGRYSVDINRIKLQRVKSFAEEEKAKSTNVLITKDGFVTTDSVLMSFESAYKKGLVSYHDSLVYAEQLRADSTRYAEKQKADSLLYVKQREFEGRYNFSINGMGWINCDKFYTGTQPKVDFSLKVGNDMQQAMSNYTLVFTNLKSIMKGTYADGYVHFGKLPEGEEVKLICVTETNNKAMACVQSFKISRGMLASLKFEEVTAETFRKKIENL